MEKIAVILPVYKNDIPKYLELSLNSVIQQDYPHDVYVGVDGPIGDELDKKLKEYEGVENVHILRFKENRGLARVLNDLLTEAHDNGFEYIARMDADDISLPDRFKKQMAYLESHPEIDVVGGSIDEIDENGESRHKTIVYPETPKGCREFFSRRNPHAHPAVLFRYRFFEKVGTLYRPEYRHNQDTMLWYDGFMKNTQNANIPDVVLHYRMTETLFKKRRNGWDFAKKQLVDRLMINKGLEYGFGAHVFAYAMFVLLISPSWMKKIAYKIFR